MIIQAGDSNFFIAAKKSAFWQFYFVPFSKRAAFSIQVVKFHENGQTNDMQTAERASPNPLISSAKQVTIFLGTR